MIIGLQGTRTFSDYNIFLRAIGTGLSMMDENDDSIIVYSAGPSNINSMALEFSNISERSLKARGIKIKIIKLSPKMLKQSIHELDYFIYLSKPKEPLSDLVDLAEAKDIEVGIYRY